ncbi:VCBS repeat-containing protein [Nannocystis sp. RBIL2]|uniref:FG-GAP repeat domain-containing protein n=1 Tax=Nannocystis sp. RBIL2 TaxID=2996788 RepID=UPI00226E445E|nr:VCBS repeat-containing protein [Nannocystis sp. RBIL2]MCY1068365.1 VCBS repeat-containing protein [Nannocystis sp. RBIL2]
MRPSVFVWFGLAACAGALACVRDDACDGGHRLFGGRCLDLGAAVASRWGFAPEAVEVADLDGDGVADLVAASPDAGAITVVWGGKDMSSGTATTWSVAAAIDGLALVDLDGDGRLDVVTAAPDDDAVAVLRNRGARELAPARLHPTLVPGPTAPRAVDLDGRGPAEIVTLHRDAHSLGVLLDLKPFVALEVGLGPVALADGDFDGDGRRDLAVALAEEAAVQLVVGDGAGGLSLGPRHPVGVAPFAVVAGDFNGDGAQDLATADALADAVSVLYGDGAGRLRARASWPTDPDPRALAAVADGTGGHVLYVLSHQTSTMQRLDLRRGVDQVGATRERAAALAAGDLDGDGRAELVYASRSGRELGRVVPDAPGFSLAPRWETGPARRAFPLDLDDDGHDEIAVVPAAEADAVVDLDRTANLQLWRAGVDEVVDIDLAPLPRVDAVVVGELDERPGRELVAWSYGQLVIAGETADEWVAGELIEVPGLTGVIVVDRDGDGRQELLLKQFFGSGSRLDHVELTADGSLSELASRPFTGLLGPVATVDRGDGGPQDLLVIAGNQLRFDDGGDEPRTITLDGVGSVVEFALHDFDADGRLDAILCTSVGMLRVDDLFGEPPGEPTRIDRSGCSQIDLHDFDGDERLDILAEQSDSSGGATRNLLSLWLQTETGGWNRLASQSLPGSSGRTRVVRLDDDSWLDLLVDEIDQPARVYDMSFGTAIADEPVFTGDLGYRFADLDGDGALDLLGVGRGLAVAHGDGQGGFSPVQQRALGDLLPGAERIWSAAVEDLDHDGDAEMIVVAQRADGWRSDLRLLEPGRAARPDEPPLLELPRVFTQIALADFDGDRGLDLLAWAGLPDPQYAVLRGDGHGGFADPSWSPIALESTAPSVRTIDLDRDGRLDLLANQSDGLVLHPGLGDGRFAEPRPWHSLSGGGFVGAGDLDRDGRPELAMLVAGGLVAVHGSPGGAVTRPDVLFAKAGAGAVVDLDGDGQLEILAGTGDALHIGRRELDGRTTFVRHDLELKGLSGIVTADFDGDGLLDLGLRSGAGVAIVRQRP